MPGRPPVICSEPNNRTLGGPGAFAWLFPVCLQNPERQRGEGAAHELATL
jgi:hypothetical protein